MRLYEAQLNDFVNDVKLNRIADILSNTYTSVFKRLPTISEKRSWHNSLRQVKDVFEVAELKDNYIAVETQIPYTARRIDVLLFGLSENKEENIVLMELKQWDNNGVTDSDFEGNIFVKYEKGFSESPHPSLQVEGYHFGLLDNYHTFNEKPKLNLVSCVYCHNYSKNEPAVLFYPKFKKSYDEYPIFTKEQVIELGQYLKERLGNGRGLEVFNRFRTSKIKPSKKLLDHTAKMIHEQQIFNLIDDQITAYNAIMTKAKVLSKLKEKSVFIIKGGPGTGKSVIALEVMGELLRKGKNVFYLTGSKSFTETLRKIVGTRARDRIKYFNSYRDYTGPKIDVFVCDEAHRMREKSKKMFDKKEILDILPPQIDELLTASKMTIFLIDEKQIVRPDEIGSVRLIKDAAIKNGTKEQNIHEYELTTQFRCNGSDAYIQWLDNVLQITPNDKNRLEKADNYEFKIFDSPHDLKKAIIEKNKVKENSSRIVAGFCWPWSEPLKDGSLVNDVKIGDFEMPWEDKRNFWKWATDKSGMGQVGTVYTSQGFEFDYIGVIIGPDLTYNPNTETFKAHKDISHDSMVTRNNNKLDNHLKNVYRVLMSRGMKGCYVYFMDKDTEKYFRSHLPEIKT
jgi:uncharacterized protein